MEWDILVILSKNTFNNIGEKHINPFYELACIYFYKTNFHSTNDVWLALLAPCLSKNNFWAIKPILDGVIRYG